MILTQNELLKQIKKKRIVIEPYDPSAIGPASIDLSLGNELRVFKKDRKKITITNNIDHKEFYKLVKIGKGYNLKPGELVLGMTKEKITLPENICAWLNSRSRFARIGLMSHITAPFISPGVSNHQVLEIFNAGNKTITLKPNVKICQMIFQQCKGKAIYQGKFKNQKL
jgi:dCTP deaminase